MAELSARGERLGSARGQTAGAGADRDSSATGLGTFGDGSDADGFLDPRIRIKVVSYPPTSIEQGYSAIAYPDLQFHRAQLQAGTCRVYYRVKTDGAGNIVFRELKTPAAKDERERYAPFVEAVTSSVEEWIFDRVAADVFVDVYFAIE